MIKTNKVSFYLTLLVSFDNYSCRSNRETRLYLCVCICIKLEYGKTETLGLFFFCQDYFPVWPLNVILMSVIIFYYQGKCKQSYPNKQSHFCSTYEISIMQLISYISKLTLQQA